MAIKPARICDRCNNKTTDYSCVSRGIDVCMDNCGHFVEVFVKERNKDILLCGDLCVLCADCYLIIDNSAPLPLNPVKEIIETIKRVISDRDFR